MFSSDFDTVQLGTRRIRAQRLDHMAKLSVKNFIYQYCIYD